MAISWSNEMINDLTLIVNYFTRNEIGGLLEKLADFFISNIGMNYLLEIM